MTEPTYGEGRARRLVELLRGLAARIEALKSADALLAAGPELLRLMGDARSELFYYEVRSTYDTSKVAESRRIVDEARERVDALEFSDGELEIDDREDEEPWRGPST